MINQISFAKIEKINLTITIQTDTEQRMFLRQVVLRPRLLLKLRFSIAKSLIQESNLEREHCVQLHKNMVQHLSNFKPNESFPDIYGKMILELRVENATRLKLSDDECVQMYDVIKSTLAQNPDAFKEYGSTPLAVYIKIAGEIRAENDGRYAFRPFIFPIALVVTTSLTFMMFDYIFG
uniref:Uncharacterized protein n=1 Tax=viral metagenome TaxID=1070528 RepID=A0A6C0C9H3_9ZZZZ